MPANGSQAIIPKARGMYAKRISMAQYEELMRRRTVPEVAALLKKHPYFKQSLATLSTSDPHRGQLEDLLGMDIFQKFEQLVHYDFYSESFSDYYLCECEVKELLKALHLISFGHQRAYLAQIPTYLANRLRIDLFAIGKATTPREIAEAVRHTPYYRIIAAYLAKDPGLQNFPLMEAQLLRYQYEYTFRLASKSFTGRELEAVESLFKREAEIYNISVVLRVKTYFNAAYTQDDIQALLMPYTFKVPKRLMNEMINAPGPEAMLKALNATGRLQFNGPITPEELDAEGGRALCHYAQRLLHLTTSPAAALAAFMTLAKQEYQNVVNVIEGVRYGLPPEKIRKLLRL